VLAAGEYCAEERSGSSLIGGLAVSAPVSVLLLVDAESLSRTNTDDWLLPLMICCLGWTVMA